MLHEHTGGLPLPSTLETPGLQMEMGGGEGGSPPSMQLPSISEHNPPPPTSELLGSPWKKENVLLSLPLAF